MSDKQRTPTEIWAEIERLFEELKQIGGLEPAAPPPAQKRNPVPPPQPQAPPYPANPPAMVPIPPRGKTPFKVKLAGLQQQLPPRDEVCSLARYFRDHPDQQSVMMVCHCPYCTVNC